MQSKTEIKLKTEYFRLSHIHIFWFQNQTTLPKSQTRLSSLQQVNGLVESKTLSPFRSVVKQVNLRDTEKVKKVKAVESKTKTDGKTVDVGSSATDSGHSKSLDNRCQELSGNDKSTSTGKDCIPDSSQNLASCEKEILPSLTSSEQGVSCLEGSENRTRPTTRSRTAALMQKQLTMARMWDDSDVHQETKEELKDKMATDEDIVKKQSGCSSAPSSVSSSQQKRLNSVSTNCPAKGFRKQNLISRKSAKEPSHSGSFYRRLTRKRSSSNGQGVGEVHSGPENEQQQRSFPPKTKRRRITGCKSHSWKKLRLLRSMSSPPSCKQELESSKETLNEIHNYTASEGDMVNAATWRNKSKQCEGIKLCVLLFHYFSPCCLSVLSDLLTI